MSFLSSKYRTHTCGELSSKQVGTAVTLSGWIHRKRDHGGVVFIDLRDNYGLTQVVFPGELSKAAEGLRIESVIQISGKVVARAAELVNPKLATGEIEVQASELKLLAASEVLPFQIAEDDKAPEAIRLRSRFLELRREKLHHNILLRSRVIAEIRAIMNRLGFTEFQTPILTASSPEGARDFIVPSRLHPGKFYALPQAPQMFKQLLMISGFDRYFQIAPCFRDEDARADRSPGEFYQLDMECSFVEQEEVFTIGERLFTELFNKFGSERGLGTAQITQAPFPRIPYDQALAEFGSDKPDLRNPLRIADVSDAFASSAFRVFRSALDGGGKVRAMAVELESIPPRKYFDDTVAAFTEWSGQGLAYIVLESEGFKGSIAKFVSEGEAAALRSKLARSGASCTVVFLAAGTDEKISLPLGKLRDRVARDFSLLEKDAYRFCWVTDFPFYEREAESGKIQFSHNPFSMPQGGLEALNQSDPLDIRAFQYDIVCNGYELSSGAIRNHLPELLYRAFEITGESREYVDTHFAGLIRALSFGAPPHGGMAPGIDRIVMLLAGEEAIREVIAFPLAQNGEDLMMNAPNTVSEKALREVHIQIKLPPEKAAANAG